MTNAINALNALATANLAAGPYVEPGDSPEIVAEMTEMVVADSTAFCVVASYLERGELDKAQSYLDAMDTSPRERALEVLEAAGALA